MIERCKTCKHWESVDVFNGSVNPPRRAMLCTSGKLREGTWDAAPDELCYAYEEGGDFEPGPEFGCVHWEAKDDD